MEKDAFGMKYNQIDNYFDAMRRQLAAKEKRFKLAALEQEIAAVRGQSGHNEPNADPVAEAFFHRITRVSQWERPVAVVASAEDAPVAGGEDGDESFDEDSFFPNMDENGKAME